MAGSGPARPAARCRRNGGSGPLVGDPVHTAGGDSVAVELQLRVTGMAELHRALGARVVGVVFGPEPR
jgi:hypothetical protein